jgi:hypothetical protein
MSDTAAWQKNNEAYLSAALKWLRLRLAWRAQRAERRSAPVALAPSQRPAQSSGWWLFKRPPKELTPSVPHPTRSDAVTEADIAQAVADMAAIEPAEPPPALIILGQRLGLSRFEAQVLLLCAAMELDTRTAGLCARAQDDAGKPYPTFALALSLLDEPAWDALSPERPLRYFRLIEINQPGGQTLAASALRADERIVNFIKGLNYLDDRLSPLLAPIEVTDAQLPPSQQAVVEAILAHIKQRPDTQHLPVIQLTGLDSGSKQLIVARVAAALDLHLYRLPVEALPANTADLETLARLWERETLLMPVTLYLDAREAEPGSPTDAGGQRSSQLYRFLARSAGLFFFDTRDVWSGLGDTSAVFEVATPTPTEQSNIWREALGAAAGAAADDVPTMLAGQFNLNATSIRRIAQTALADKSSEPLPDRLWKLCLVSTRPRLESLAQRLDPKATWNDLVLPAEAISLLRQIAAQVRQRMKVYEDWGFRQRMNRGLGINALFTGESGTGKTMAAEVIANELRLDLYRIDLSAVVSKYIGETEKNLRRLFDAAEDGGAILFFDEADALFGKRSEVKDSHDRYANIEINYLLQRMEAYRGLAILATNMKSALDPAFTRRLRFIVNFPFPGTVERKLIWQKVFPPQMPMAELDFDRLARLNLTGGSIHNIAVNAAFLAASRQPLQLTMPIILEAARTEFRKLERPINETEFAWPGPNGAKP